MNAPGADYWDRLPFGRGVRLLHRDANGVAALDKPAGVLSHPNSPRDEARALLACRYDPERECYHWTGPAGEPCALWLLNRLDSATSGVILAAAGAATAAAIKAQFARHQIRKVYQAVVFGLPRAARETWRDRLTVSRGGAGLRTEGRGHLPAEAAVTVLRRRPGPPPLALLRLEPRTGRTHQLRVQCARRHLPIVGDQTYGDFRRNREFARATGIKRLLLHSHETSFRYELGGRNHPFAASAALPEEFQAALA